MFAIPCFWQFEFDSASQSAVSPMENTRTHAALESVYRQCKECICIGSQCASVRLCAPCALCQVHVRPRMRISSHIVSNHFHRLLSLVAKIVHQIGSKWPPKHQWVPCKKLAWNIIVCLHSIWYWTVLMDQITREYSPIARVHLICSPKRQEIRSNRPNTMRPRNYCRS